MAILDIDQPEHRRVKQAIGRLQRKGRLGG
jgi:hypothetical protein